MILINGTDKKSKIFYLMILVVFLATFASFSLILILINNKIVIDQSNVNLFDMFVKSSFTLIGSTLSGLVAIFIFSLQEGSKKKEKLDNQEKHYKNIIQEFETNISVLERIESMLDIGTFEEVANDILEEKEVKEMLLVIYTQLNFTFYINHLSELKMERYGNSIRVFKLTYQVYKYIDLIVNKLNSKQNVKVLLGQMKRDIIKIKSLQNIMEQ
ncbi:BhlA/UviB family holin-like peptide [Bacillus sp. CB102A.1]